MRQCLPAVAAIAAPLFGTGLIVPAAAQGTAPPVVLVYTEQDGEASILHTFVIEPISSGYAIELTSRGGRGGDPAALADLSGLVGGVMVLP